MTKSQRLFIVVFFPLLGLAMLWILFDISTEDSRAWSLEIGLLAATVSLLAGRWFMVWMQRRGLEKRQEQQAREMSIDGSSRSKSLVYAAAGLGAIFGPVLLQVISVNSALLLCLVAFFAFLTGWGMAPDLVSTARRAALQEPGTFDQGS